MPSLHRESTDSLILLFCCFNTHGLAGASPSPPDSSIQPVQKKRGKRTAGVSEKGTAVGAKSNLTTLIRESRKYIEKNEKRLCQAAESKGCCCCQAGW